MMASSSASRMDSPSSGPNSPTKVTTVPSVLSDNAESLVATNNERLALQENIKNMVQEINQSFTDYWIMQAKTLNSAVKDAGGDADGIAWQIPFASQETLRAKAAAAKQKELWSQMEHMLKEAKDRDASFWASWQTSLDHLARPDEPAQQSSSARPRGAGASDHRPRREKRLTRAAVKSIAPKGPTAFSVDRDKLRFTKPSRPDSAQHSALSESSGIVKHATPVASDNDSDLPYPSTSPSTAVPVSPSSSGVNRIKSITPQETKARAPRRLAARSFSKPTKPVKKRTPQSAAKSPSNPQPVTDPTPGQLYQAYYHSTDAKERGWYMGTVLPWKSSDWADKTRIDFSMRDIDLLSAWPECCQPGFKTEAISPDGQLIETKELVGIDKWMPGFEDGGPRVMDRKFLFLFFEDRPKRLGCLDMEVSKPMKLIKIRKTDGEAVPLDWVEAKNLRLNVDDKAVRGARAAEEYKTKLDQVVCLRDEEARNASITATSQQHSEAPLGMPTHSSTSGSKQQGSTGGDTEKDMAGGRIDDSAASNKSTHLRPWELSSHIDVQCGRQQNGGSPPFFSPSFTERPSGTRVSQKEHGSNAFSNALSPVQMDIDEAYEEPQTYTKRNTGKRPLSNDLDEYDEGLGMDYDLNLQRPTTTMSRPHTSLVGLPPIKLPRLDDYILPGPSTGGSGFRSPGVGYMNADIPMSSSRPGSAVSLPGASSPTHGLGFMRAPNQEK